MFICYYWHAVLASAVIVTATYSTMMTVLLIDRRYFSRRIVREIQKACDRASAYLIARDEVVYGCRACW